MSGTFYSDEDIYMRSPGLEPVYPKAAPSPSPPPVVTKVYHPPVSSPSSRRRKKANRRKTRPTQGDWVLIREMDPNRPDIAQQVSQQALNSDTGSDEDEMEDQSPDTATAPMVSNTTQLPRSFVHPFSLQQATRNVTRKEDPQTATSAHRDSVLDADIRSNAFISERRVSEAAPVNILPNAVRANIDDTRYTTPIGSASMSSATSPSVQRQRNGSVANVWPMEEPATHLRQLQIPQTRDKLPAFQPQSPPRDAASPNTQQLPSIQHMVGDLARSPSISEEIHRSNSFVHRQSVSSVGQSPTSIVRQLSLNSNSPATQFPPFSASSPVSAASDLQKGDLFLRSGGHVFGADHRRPSQASENGRYPSTLHSNSTSDGYQSSDGPSPVAQTPNERNMSIDGTLAASAPIILPPPNGSGMQHVPSQAVGTFRCDFTGCTAAPFQTQYLLNSHTNVHSQSRPHYCPVEGCPRSDGGKGFKRKNEMIRHGLVHQSPGYVCPFCPDREHKYPRPDNLQRHVRVHHVDKDKDDPDLRDVLAQRPEGGSRGRRRRVSGV